MRYNVFRKKSNTSYYLLSVVVSIVIAIVVVLGVSLCCGFKYRIVSTNSMEPNIKTGSLIIENKVDFDELKVGDVITYTRSYEKDVKVTHRITKIDGNTLVVQGDNPEHTQIDTVTEQNYVGKVVASLPYVKDLFNWVYNNIFHILFVVVMVIIAYQIIWV